MRRTFRFSFLLFAVFISAAGCKKLVKLDLPPEPAINMEQEWIMLGRNPQRQHFVHHNIPPPLDIVWSKRVKSVIADHPLAMGNIIFAPTVSGVMYVVDYNTGEGIGSGKLGPSIERAPSIYHNILYAGLTLGPETLVGWDIRKGGKEISRNYPHITTSPTVLEDKLYFGTDRNLFFCVNFYSGEMIWNYNTAAAVHSSPAFNLPEVIFGDDHGWFYSLEASSGIEMWKIQLDGSILSHPVIDDSVAYVGTVNGKMYAILLKNGDIAWEQSFDGAIYSSPALYQNMIYFGNNAHDVIALHKKTGELVWKFNTDGIVNTVPLPSPDYIYVTSWDRNLYVLDRYSGKLIFKQGLGYAPKSSPIIYRDYLLIQTANDQLIAFANEKFVEEWRKQR